MKRFLFSACLIALLPAAVFASGWGTLQVAAEREWTTEKEPRPRVTKFRWIEPDRVLEARHGFVSRLQFGESKFADTVQRMVLDPKTGKINVIYTYEDGRPPLKTVMTIGNDGSLVETFTDAKGVKKRNIYKAPAPNVSLIERQEMRGTTWATLGTTRKGGLTHAEIAEIARRKEQERLAVIARDNARRAAERAQREAEENARYAEAEQESSEPPMMGGMTPLDVLNGLASSINQQNQRQQAQFERQMRSYNSGRSSSGGGAIIVDNAPAPTSSPAPSYTPSAPAATSGQFGEGAIYYDCFGAVRQRSTSGDYVATMYYGIVTSPRGYDGDGAKSLFRSQTGSDQAGDTESAGVGCHPYKSRGEAEAANRSKISRDAGGRAKQVTGINLTL